MDPTPSSKPKRSERLKQKLLVLSAAAFTDTSSYLRVWFGENANTFTQLSPDQAIASVPFALQAQQAANATNADNAANLNNNPASFYQNAGNLNAGTLSTDRFSAYADLGAEGYLDNSAAGDLLTQSQGDGRYVKQGQANSVNSNMIGSGTIALSNLGQNGCSNGQGLKWNGSAWACQDDNAVNVQYLGRTWTTTLDHSVADVGNGSSIAIGSDGLPLIGYYDTTNGHFKVAHCGNLSCNSNSSNYLTAVDNSAIADSNNARNSSITIGADGLGLISYYDNTNHDLKVLHCGVLLCNSGNTITPIEPSGNVGVYSSITTGSDGLGLISYYDDGNGNLKVLHCGNAQCSSGNTTTSADTSGDVGYWASIAIGQDGLALISYDDQTNFNLKALHCGNLLCSSGNTITTVDNNKFVGQYTSIMIGSDGRGLISYYDNGANSDLKVLHCGNMLCNAGNTITSVDTKGDVGVFSSIAIGADGLGLISYIDYNNSSLKMLHCGNLLCNNGDTTSLVAPFSFGVEQEYTSITIGPDGLGLISYGYYDGANYSLKVTKLAGLGRR